MNIIMPDLGCGNFASVLRMASEVGISATLTSDPAALERADKVILAGVGAFDHAMSNLRSGGWYGPLNDAVLTRAVPVLGICLGMQLMCEGSDEGSEPGLGWIDAFVRRFSFPADRKLRVPHMGWNTVSVRRENPLIDDRENEQRFYFAHSFYVECANEADIAATTHYGIDFPAAFVRGSMHGVQFHPEKSHRFGKALMRRFLSR
jgi:imidazole glycerol-phosphate synthase subunit HisH